MKRTLRTLVIGGGGREHALCWALRQSPQVEQVWCAPGNAGIAEIAKTVEVADHDARALVAFAQRERIDLTIVGPDRPLAEGMVDEFQRNKLRVFGPTAAAASLESSKAFAKEFMRRHFIPTAPFRVFDRVDDALKYINASDPPLVVKADGLAAGKGVIVCADREQAQAAVKKVMVERAFGSAGERIVVERMLVGEEISVMAFADGHRVVPMLPARDYKRVLDNDLGPNTGGMGAFAPSRLPDDEVIREIHDQILQPTIAGMRQEGRPFVGVLYAGLMLTDAGPRVLEFNARFGDPETQAVLPLLKSDLVDIIGAALAGSLDMETVVWREEYCAGVIVASRGYPGKYETGVPVEGPIRTNVNETFCFHAGTARDGSGRLVTAGGRVIGLFARSPSHEGAVAAAYALAEKIRFKGAHYRTDIGLRSRQAPRPRRPEVAVRR